MRISDWSSYVCASDLRRRQADADDRIGAQPALVLGAVEIDHRRVEIGLIFGVHPQHRLGDVGIDRIDRRLHALAAPAARIAVALLDRLVRARRLARGPCGAAATALFEDYLVLDRGVDRKTPRLAPSH